MGSPTLLRRSCLRALFTLTVVANGFAAENFVASTHAAGAQQVEFDVFLPLTHRAELNQLLTDQDTVGSPQYHQWITPAQFRERFGPNRASLNRVTNLLANNGFSIVQVHGHGVRVQGSVSAAESLFSTSIWNGAGLRGHHKLIARQPIVMPSALQDAGAQVVRFSSAVRMQPHSTKVTRLNASDLDPENRTSAHGGYWSTDLRQAYEFPSYESLTGRGVRIGILMSNDFRNSDMTLYFNHEKIPPPKIVRRPVFGGAPFDPDESTEVSLDIQQSAGMAPGAIIYDYNIPDLSDSAVLGGYVSIIESNEVDIVNSSFGGFEAQYLPDYNDGQDLSGILNVYEDLFKQGNAQGITFVASSGDFGGLGNPPIAYLNNPPTNPPIIAGYFTPGVQVPASSPEVTSVGGTNLITTFTPGSLTSNYVRENADGDPLQPFDIYGVGNLVAGGYWGSAGGKSAFFKKPDYQKLVKTGSSFRTVPDISLHMGGCPGGISYLPCGPDRSYDVVVVGGSLYGVIGTSASSPDIAGLLALREQFVPGRMGNANSYIYQLAQDQFAGTSPVTYFHEGIPGFNGYDQTTGKGYNRVLGNGTVFGKNFIGASALPSAGDPQSPSNP